MTCEQALELLPWYLNGTLEAKERAEVRHHLATCEACRQALAETREAWRIFDQHLPSTALVALAGGEDPEGIDPSLAERHLATCPQCAAELELARTSRHLSEDDRVALFAKPSAAREARSGARTWRTAALAASLTAAVAMTGWIYSAQQAGRETELAVNTPILQLYSGGEGEVERGVEDGAVAPAGVPVPVVLNPRAGVDIYERYEVNVLSPSGELLFHNQELTLQEESYLSFLFSFPKPGRYEIQLFGLRDGRRGEQAGIYEVRADAPR